MRLVNKNSSNIGFGDLVEDMDGKKRIVINMGWCDFSLGRCVGTELLYKVGLVDTHTGKLMGVYRNIGDVINRYSLVAKNNDMELHY